MNLQVTVVTRSNLGKCQFDEKSDDVRMGSFFLATIEQIGLKAFVDSRTFPIFFVRRGGSSILE